MTEEKEAKLFDVGHPASDFILEWWAALKENKGDRAELRRCKNLQEVQLASAYQRCYWNLMKHFPEEQRKRTSKEQISIIIGLAAHIEENDFDKKCDQNNEKQIHDYFGYQIGRGDQPLLSELRFRRLLRIKDRETLFSFLIQVGRILDRKTNLLDLLTIAYFWGDKTKIDLAYKYYELAKLGK